MRFSRIWSGGWSGSRPAECLAPRPIKPKHAHPKPFIITRMRSRPRFASIPFAVSLIVAAAGCSASGEGEFDDIGSSAWGVHTVCAAGDTVPGIDVSKWQGTIDWTQVKQDGVVFAIARASHGIGTIDSFFDANWAGMKSNGIVRGVYQYWNPAEDPIAQADILISKVNGAGGLQPDDLPPVIDIESTDSLGAAEMVANATAWLDHVEAALHRRPMIYTGSYFWDGAGLGDSLNGHPLWGPHYTSNPCPLISDSWSKWTMWQYSSTGAVAGISGNVDMDKFNGTQADLEQFIKDSSTVPVEPEAGPPEASTPEAEAPEAEASAPDVIEPDAAEELDAAPPAKDAAAIDARDEASLDSSPAAEDYLQASTCACRTAGARSVASPGLAVALALAAAAVARRAMIRRPGSSEVA